MEQISTPKNKVEQPLFSGTKFEKKIEELGLHTTMVPGEKNIACLSRDPHLHIPEWLIGAIQSHSTSYDISEDKWCNRIAGELNTALDPEHNQNIQDESWGYESEVLSGEYNTPSSEGYAFHSVVVVTVSRWDEKTSDYVPTEYISIDITAPNLKKNFQVLAVLASNKEELLKMLNALYGGTFKD